MIEDPAPRHIQTSRWVSEAPRVPGVYWARVAHPEGGARACVVEVDPGENHPCCALRVRWEGHFWPINHAMFLAWGEYEIVPPRSG
jgi:hypothetical protein